MDRPFLTYESSKHLVIVFKALPNKLRDLSNPADVSGTADGCLEDVNVVAGTHLEVVYVNW
jgi:hypothetical protein